MNRRCKIYKESVSFSLIFKPVRSTRNIFGWKQPGPLPQGTPRSGVGSQGPVLLTLVASDSSRKPAFATLSVLLTCRDAIARCDVAGNCCVSSPAGAGVCRSRKHGSCEPIDMLFHLQKLSQRHNRNSIINTYGYRITIYNFSALMILSLIFHCGAVIFISASIRDAFLHWLWLLNHICPSPWMHYRLKWLQESIL